ncbi:MAG: hypothetical protein J6V13_05060 [Paludibacteraceae bacterium]|nr:hypothetical protein [Paludibacteraceae bacterium]
MAKIDGKDYPGIKLERTATGKGKIVTINLQKCETTVKDFLHSMGIECDEVKYDPKFVKKIREAEKEPTREISDIHAFLGI